jgi:ribosomal protein S18 acetylase RimI-like enzyme
MHPCYSTRRATEADYRYCHRLTKRNMSDLFRRHWGGWDPSAFRAGFEPKATAMVIVRGRRAGYYCVRKVGGDAYIDNMQPSPALQGRVIGTELLARILRDHGSRMIRLTTFSDNPAKRLYSRGGFIVTGRGEAILRMTRYPPKNPSAVRKKFGGDYVADEHT